MLNKSFEELNQAEVKKTLGLNQQSATLNNLPNLKKIGLEQQYIFEYWEKVNMYQLSIYVIYIFIVQIFSSTTKQVETF